MNLRQKSGWTYFFLSIFIFVLSIPQVRANPVYQDYEHFFNMPHVFLFLFIIPSTLVFTSLIEFLVYIFIMFHKKKKVKPLLTNAFYVNLITVPIIQWIAFAYNLYLLVEIEIYIALEVIIIIVEYLILESEMSKIAQEKISKKLTFFMVLVANLVSFLFGFVYFYFFSPMLSLLSEQRISLSDDFGFFLLCIMIFVIPLTTIILFTFYYYKYRNSKYSEITSTICIFLIMITIYFSILFRLFSVM